MFLNQLDVDFFPKLPEFRHIFYHRIYIILSGNNILRIHKIKIIISMAQMNFIML